MDRLFGVLLILASAVSFEFSPLSLRFFIKQTGCCSC